MNLTEEEWKLLLFKISDRDSKIRFSTTAGLNSISISSNSKLESMMLCWMYKKKEKGYNYISNRDYSMTKSNVKRAYQQEYDAVVGEGGKVIDVYAKEGKIGGIGVVVAVTLDGDKLYYVPIMIQNPDEEMYDLINNSDDGLDFIAMLDSAGWETYLDDWVSYSRIPDF